MSASLRGSNSSLNSMPGGVYSMCLSCISYIFVSISRREAGSRGMMELIIFLHLRSSVRVVITHNFLDYRIARAGLKDAKSFPIAGSRLASIPSRSKLFRTFSKFHLKNRYQIIFLQTKTLIQPDHPSNSLNYRTATIIWTP
jgi:hypothetical protein